MATLIGKDSNGHLWSGAEKVFRNEAEYYIRIKGAFFSTSPSVSYLGQVNSFFPHYKRAHITPLFHPESANKLPKHFIRTFEMFQLFSFSSAFKEKEEVGNT